MWEPGNKGISVFPVFFLNLDKELKNYTRGIFCDHMANKA